MTEFENASSANQQESDEADLTDEVGVFIEYFLTLDRWEKESDREEARRTLLDPNHPKPRCSAEFEGMCFECCVTDCPQKGR